MYLLKDTPINVPRLVHWDNKYIISLYENMILLYSFRTGTQISVNKCTAVISLDIIEQSFTCATYTYEFVCLIKCKTKDSRLYSNFSSET